MRGASLRVRSLGVLTAVLLAACASSRPSASKADVPTPAEPAPATAVAPTSEAAAALTPAPPPAIPTGARLPGPFHPPGGLPFVAPGQSRTESEGCLALANPETEGPTRAPAVENTRGGGADGPEVALRQTGGSITLTHALHHNCCQKADVKTVVEGEKVTVTETFTGDTCRCNCRSTLTTTVGLKPGTYSIEVVRVDNGPPKTIYSGTATLQSLLAPKPR